MTRANINKYQNRLNNLFVAALFLLIQFAAPIFASGALIETATAAPICVVDTAEANDEPGQKDLTKLCVDYDGAPTTISTTWNWDDLGTTGSNTLDACNLFDTDGNGNINYAVCVTTQNTPAALQALTTYSCGDAKIDRCTTTATVIPNGSTSCAVTQQNTDPFTAGNNSPKDTQGSCTIQLSAVGGAGAKLIDVCSYPSAQPNSDPSDCVIARNDFGKVELIKHLDPTTDPGLFNLSIDGPQTGDTTTVNNRTHNGTTGEVVIKKGSVTVSETAGTSTSLPNYSTTIVCRDLNGTGTIVGSGSPTGSSSRQLTFTLAEDADVVCIATNTRQSGSVTLIKSVTNDNGGTLGVNAFGLSIGGQAVNSGQTVSVPVGTSVVINETGATGYSFVSITGTGCPVQLGGTVTPAANQNITCTISNNDIAPQLTVIKNVINDNGGTSLAPNFSMQVSGTNVSNTSFAGSETGTTITLNAGSYSVSETGPTGYAAGYSTDCSGTIALGQSKTCTVTNNDIAPTLTLIKTVVNNNGGLATTANFQGKIDGVNVAWNSAITKNAGSYTTSEQVLTGGEGYAASAWTGDCAENGAVTLGVGQNKTCYITNDDIAPLLTVTKTVTNDNGGTLTVTDFPLYVGNVQVVSGQQTSFNAGSYLVTETNQSGYQASGWGGNCDVGGNITLVVGGVYTCTINNNDQPATIIVDKSVVNNNGGNADDGDWSLFVNQTRVLDEVANTFPGNTAYTISEDNGPDGYSQTSIICNDVTNARAPISVTHPFTAQLGHTYRCTVTNDDIAPTLTLKKVVLNDNGGNDTAGDWILKAQNGANPALINEAGAENLSGTEATTQTVAATAGIGYALSEAGPSGYTASNWNCTNGTLQNSTITLSPGQNATCTITNNDQPAELILAKNIINDNGGSAVQSDFTPLLNGTATTWGARNVIPGTYTVGEVTPTNGYTNTGTSCYVTGYPAVGISHPVIIDSGQSLTCVVTNDDQPGSISGTKFKVNAGATNGTGGTLLAGWTIYLDLNNNNERDTLIPFTEPFAVTDSDGKYIFTNLGPGTYTVREELKADWTQIFPSSPGFELSVILAQGQNSVGNDFGNFENGSASGFKFNDLDGNGIKHEDEPKLPGWQIFIDDNDNQAFDSGELETTTNADGNFEFSNLAPGTYNICETLQANWVQTTTPKCYAVLINISGETNPAIVFGNQGRGSLKVLKNVDTNGDGVIDITGATDWTWDILAGLQNIAAGNTINVAAGTFSIHEDQKANYYFSSVSCTRNGQSFTVNQNETVTNLVVNAGDDIVCTFTNHKKPAGQVLGITTLAAPVGLADTGETSNPLTNLLIGLAIFTIAIGSTVLVRKQPITS